MRKPIIINITLLNDSNLVSTIKGKEEKYSELWLELTELWGMPNIVPSNIKILTPGTGYPWTT